MGKPITFVFASVIVLLFVSGCAQQGAVGHDSSTGDDMGSSDSAVSGSEIDVTDDSLDLDSEEFDDSGADDAVAGLDEALGDW